MLPPHMTYTYPFAVIRLPRPIVIICRKMDIPSLAQGTLDNLGDNGGRHWAVLVSLCSLR